MGLLSYRLATSDDVALLVAWHADPDVARYWDGETFTADEMRARLGRPDVDMWIVEEDGEPVGHLQSWWDGRGVMPTVARLLAFDLLAQGWAEVTVDPYEWNARAIRAWRKAGFVEVSRGHLPDEDHSARWVLMRFDPGSAKPNQRE